MDDGSAGTSIHDGQEGAVIINVTELSQEVQDMYESMAKTTERMEADFSKVERPRSSGFPPVCGRSAAMTMAATSRRAWSPSARTYHRGAPHLHKMEEVKLAAACYLCRDSGRSPSEVYEKVRSVTAAARACYDADDPSMAGLGDADFAAMMFLDGCFLLQSLKYMVGDADVVGDAAPVLQNRMALSTGHSIYKDIFLIENQIPWLVLHVLREFTSIDVGWCVSSIGDKFLPQNGKASGRDSRRREEYEPQHLLGVLRFTKVGYMPADMVRNTGFPLTSVFPSVVELAEMGVPVIPSTAPWFADMRLRRGHVVEELLLSPVFLSDITACWLVNMTALEMTVLGASRDTDGFVVSSYLSMLAMLMNREEDVYELRRRRLLQGALSNEQAFFFFKDLGQHLRLGNRYYAALKEIESYKRHRAVRIAWHKFTFNYYKAISAVLILTGAFLGIYKYVGFIAALSAVVSIAGVLVSI